MVTSPEQGKADPSRNLARGEMLFGGPGQTVPKRLPRLSRNRDISQA
jgi:hypothetical protein